MIGDDDSEEFRLLGPCCCPGCPPCCPGSSDTRENIAGGTQYFVGVGNRNLMEDGDVEFTGSSNTFPKLVTPISVYLKKMVNC